MSSRIIQGIQIYRTRDLGNPRTKGFRELKAILYIQGHSGNHSGKHSGKGFSGPFMEPKTQGKFQGTQ